MKEEFEERLNGMTVSDEEYKLIEYVYANHPIFNDKDKTAQAYLLFGISIFKALKPAAVKFHDACNAMREANIIAECRREEYHRMIDSLHTPLGN